MPTCRRLLALLGALLAALVASPTASGAGSMIAPAGDGASISVDSAGTGHIAFASSATADVPFAYRITYCRLPRGATACALRKDFATPSNASTFGRTQVLTDGNRVIILAYLLSATTPVVDGVFAWTSTDGGTTWGSAVQVAPGVTLDAAVLGPGSNAVSVLSQITTGGIEFGYGPLSGGGTKFQLGATSPPTGGLWGYADLGLLNTTQPYAVAGTDDGIWLRRFDTTKSGLTNAGSWLPAQLVDNTNVPGAAEPVTAYGPNGAFIGYGTKNDVDGGYPYYVRRLSDDGTIGEAQAITGGTVSAVNYDMTQDASGRLYVAFQDNHDDNHLYYVWSKRGATWSQPIRLAGDDETIGSSSQIAAAPDGGGWVVTTDGGGAFNPIRVFPFDPKGDEDPGAPTPAPGTAATPGTTAAPDPCPATVTVATGVLAKVRSGACFESKSKTEYQTTGSVRVNGIDFTAPASGTFTVNTKAHTVTAKGSYTVQAGSIVLAKGSRTWTVTQPNSVDGLSAFGVKLFGLGVSGKADLTFDAKGAAITINVDLPYPLDAVRGRTTLRTTMETGLIVDGVQITADTVPIGPLEIRDLNLTYTGQNDAFEGHADVFLPPAAKSAITASFGLQGGAFKHAELEVGAGIPPLPLPLWGVPPITLNRVGLAASADNGFHLAGGVQLVLGTEIAGLTPLAIDALPSSGGGVKLDIPKQGNYAVISATGKLTVLDLPVAIGKVAVDTRGPITFSGGTDLDFAVIAIRVNVSGGFNLSNADFFAQGTGGACISLVLASGCAKVSAILSSIGIAACGALKLKENLTGVSVTADLGYDRPWGGSSHLGSCQLDKYKPASLGGGARAHAARATTDPLGWRAQAGGRTITLGAGDLRGIRVTGAGGVRPGFTLSGPGGRTITVPAASTEPVVASAIAAVPVGGDAIEVQVHQPHGSWTLTPAEGSTINTVETAQALPVPKVSASVRTLTGRSRQITVRASNLGDQQLIVREVLPSGTAHELGKVRANGTKALRFTPADGPAGKRQIEAIVVAAGRQVATKALGSYVAPGTVKLAAPRRVTLSRNKRSLGVRWTKVAGAAKYRVTITATDGRKQILTAAGKASKLTIPQVTADDQVKVKVAAVDRLGRPGSARTATSKATKKSAKSTTSKAK
ncbi:MAG: hypothetical protein QM679_06450 [Patulibacter sp.]